MEKNKTLKAYADALFSLVCDENCDIELYVLKVKAMKDVFDNDPEYAALLSCPAVPISERISYLESAFGDFLPEYLLSFTSLLIEKGQIGFISDICAYFIEAYNKKMGIKVAKIRSATELDDKQKQKLEAALEKRISGKIIPEYTVDPTLLGGIIIEADGLRLDGTLRQSIDGMKELIQSGKVGNI